MNSDLDMRARLHGMTSEDCIAQAAEMELLAAACSIWSERANYLQMAILWRWWGERAALRAHDSGS